jgi:predicted nucleotide-binding protein
MAKKKEEKTKAQKNRGKYLKQSDVPKWPISKAIKIAKAIYDNFAGDPTSPLQVAAAMDISPTSSNWQEIPGASVAYGLTKGGYNASQISITELGLKIIAPQNDGDDSQGLLEAVIKPRVLNEFFTKYANSKFPRENIAKNVLVSMGVPQSKVDAVLEMVIENGNYVGILQEIKGNQYINIKNPTPKLCETESNEKASEEVQSDGELDKVPDELSKKLGFQKSEKAKIPEEQPKKVDRVFISHGKNKKIVNQLKEILKFGKFETVISVEKESLAIPVPEKVFKDMRECTAAVLHIEKDQELMDKEGNVHHTLNSNVLIEIGAAIALYKKNFILLCEKSINLPSNLQGLYRCNYEGNQLDYEATMKLLKAFNDFS